jgi:hypothetical protein
MFVFWVILGLVVFGKGTRHALIFRRVVLITITKTNAFLQAMEQLVFGREPLSYIQVRAY